jgi:hypothetical protein
VFLVASKPSNKGNERRFSNFELQRHFIRSIPMESSMDESFIWVIYKRNRVKRRQPMEEMYRLPRTTALFRLPIRISLSDSIFVMRLTA